MAVLCVFEHICSVDVQGIFTEYLSPNLACIVLVFCNSGAVVG